MNYISIMEFECLSTDRLLLRKLTPEVYDYMHTHFKDDELYNFLGLQSATELEREKWKHSRGLSTYNRSFLFFQIIEKESMKVLGWCGFHTWYTDHRRAEIGYMLYNQESMGKGIMREAVKPVIDYGFNQMGLNRIEAFVSIEGNASTRILTRFGFIREGHLRSHYYKNGVMEDSLMYALLVDDYVK